VFDANDFDEWFHSHHTCPLFNIDSSPIHPSLSVVSDASAPAPLSQLDEQDRHHHNTNNNNNTKRLSQEEKLLIAQEKRGKQIPSAEEQRSLLTAAHAAGHFGEKFMFTYIDNRGFWWPRMRQDIAQVISKCRDCQRYNITRTGFHPSHSITAARPADHFQIDLAKLPQSIDGHNYCMVLVDVFSGFVMLQPIKDKEAPTVARAIWNVCCVIGVPRILQSDNGGEFSNKVVNALCRLTGIERRFIAAYNPRSDGKVERVVKVVKDTVVKLLHGASALWPLYIPFVQLAYNNKVRDLTGSSPFSLMFGRQMNELKDYTQQPIMPVNMNEWKEHQDKVMSLIFPAIHQRIKGKQEEMRKKLDKMRKKVIADELVPGTVVMIKDPQYLLHPSVRPSTQPMWIGPYTIVRRTLYGPYILRTDTGELYPRQVNIDQMKIVFSPQHLQTDTEKEKEEEGADNTYEVDYIIKHKEDDGVMKYFIKWKGWDVEDSTWETEEAFNDPQPVERYWKLQVAKQQASRVSSNALLADNVQHVTVSLQHHQQQ
jgi:transposase InsO family protein